MTDELDKDTLGGEEGKENKASDGSPEESTKASPPTVSEDDNASAIAASAHKGVEEGAQELVQDTAKEAAQDDALELKKEDSEAKTEAPELNKSDTQKAEPQSHVSQAVIDLESAGDGPIESPKVQQMTQPKVKKLNQSQESIWNFFTILNMVFMILWTIGSFIGGRPYCFTALILTLAFGLLSFPRLNFFSTPTKAGIAFFGSALALLITSLHNSDISILYIISIPVVWALVLTALWVYVFVSVNKLFWKKHRKLAILFGILLLYPAWGLLSSILGYFSPETKAFTLSHLLNSPKAASGVLPWFLTPAFFFSLLVPIAAAILFFRYETKLIFSPGLSGRHFAGLFLGLGSLVLVLAGFLDITGENNKFASLHNTLRSKIPTDGFFWRNSEVLTGKAGLSHALSQDLQMLGSREAQSEDTTKPQSAALPEKAETTPPSAETTAPASVGASPADTTVSTSPADTAVGTSPAAREEASADQAQSTSTVPQESESTQAGTEAQVSEPQVSEPQIAQPPVSSETFESSQVPSDESSSAVDTQNAQPLTAEVPIIGTTTMVADAKKDAQAQTKEPSATPQQAATETPTPESVSPEGGSETEGKTPKEGEIPVPGIDGLTINMPHIKPGYSLGPDTTIYFNKEEAPSPFYFDENSDPSVPPKPPTNDDQGMNSANQVDLAKKASVEPDAAVVNASANVAPVSPNTPMQVIQRTPPEDIDYLRYQNENINRELQSLNSRNNELSSQLNDTREELTKTQDMYQSLLDRVQNLEEKNQVNATGN